MDMNLLICLTGTRLKMQPIKIGPYAGHVHRHCEKRSDEAIHAFFLR
jgi:hypothetical protein